MSKLLENKQQLIHVASEVVVLIGLTFYFSSKNKKLMQHIEDLAQRLEEQEDLIQKHEQIIRQLVATVSNINQPRQRVAQPVTEKKSVRAKQKPKKTSKQVKFKQPLIKVISSDENVSEDESDLDRELVEELNDLDDDEHSLKKE